ncbi:SGNH hydrolase-type esterase domain-containing protein [Phyllosticta citrichinensis]|uniref:SGNH hydrolase-type esterase domain-containing protein n=1 Tax=Phyllosticta citrichinensis TaxID=1130410 RepID=A0ABR1XNH1_9PEZI
MQGLLNLRLFVFVLLLQLRFTSSYPHGHREAALLKGDPDVLTRSIHGEHDHWVPVWTAMPQLVEPANLPPAPFNGTTATFTNTTLRQTIHLTTHISSIRLVLSNAFGTTPLSITRATIALSRQQNATSNASGAGSSIVDPTTLVVLSFNGGCPNVGISEGATVVSDAIDFAAEAQADVSVSLYLAEGQQGKDVTGHPGSRTTSWLSHGDRSGEEGVRDDGTETVAHWYFISALLASSSRHHRSLVLIGDSLTDGRGSTTDANNRWPDQLLSLLHSNTTSPLRGPFSILNQAAGGNALLLPPSASGPNGPPALARLDRDVLSFPGGPSHVLVFIGINDIGVTAATESAQADIAAALIAGYKELVTRVRVATAWRGRTAREFAATLTPFCADAACGKSDVQQYSSQEREVARQAVNSWIRGTQVAGWFDGVVDLDRAVRNDSEGGSVLRADLDSGDHLHLNVKGYGVLARAMFGFGEDVGMW